MEDIDCLLVGHYALSVGTQIKLAESAFGKNSPYYLDALEKTFLTYKNKKYTSSQLYNLFYTEGEGDLSFDHVTFEHSFNTAIANIGTYLLRKGLTIDYVNTFNKGKQRLASLLSENRVVAVAIVTTFYITGFPISQIVSYIRKYSPDVNIVVGGPFIRNLLTTYKNNLSKLNIVLEQMGADFYVYSGEGERTLSSLIEALKTRDQNNKVANIFYKCGEQFVFSYEETENRPFNQPMSDWRYFIEDIPDLVNIRTSKSCPFDCAFCGLPVAGGKAKLLPVSEVEKELRSLRDTGKEPGIFFIDETLNFPETRFKEMLRMMIRNDFPFKWEAELRCNSLDSETVQLMADSGCQLVHLGIESANQNILDKMSKRVDVNDYYRALDLLNEHNIMSSALILVGFPGETERSFQDTFDFIEKWQPTFFRVHRWFYDHETPVHRNRQDYRLQGGGYNWKHFSMNSIEAHKLADTLSLTVQNAVHTDDYTMAFYLLTKGYSKAKVRSFLSLFDLAIREKCQDACAERINSYVNQMKTVLH